MPKNISIILLDKEKKKIDKISIETPQNLEDLLLSINKLLKNLPENFVIYYIYDEKEMYVQIKDEFKLLSEILYVRPKNPKDKEQAIFQKINISNKSESSEEKTTDESKANQQEKENEKKNENEITENTSYLGKAYNFLQTVMNKIKEISFFSSNPDLPYSCILRIESKYPDISYDNIGKE
jgi:vacuolar-type H+-ATPase catalytic subunit A/Vma1